MLLQESGLFMISADFADHDRSTNIAQRCISKDASNRRHAELFGDGQSNRWAMDSFALHKMLGKECGLWCGAEYPARSRV